MSERGSSNDWAWREGRRLANSSAVFRYAALAILLLAAGCKQDCSTLCQQQLGCATTLDPDASVLVGPRCDQLCASGEYVATETCANCLDSLGVCAATADGGYVYQGCDSVCPQVDPVEGD